MKTLNRSVFLFVGFFLILFFSSTNLIAQTDYIYYTANASNDVRRAELDGSNITVLITGENTPRGIEVDFVNNKLIYIDGQGNVIKRANLDGSNLETIISGLSEPIQMDIDFLNNKIYFTDNGSDKIMTSDLDGSNLMDVLTGLANPSAIAVDAANGKMYWSDNVLNSIQKANLDGSNIETILSGTLVSGMAIDNVNGKLYYSDRTNNEIRVINLDGTNIQTIGTANTPTGMTVDLINGKVYWVDQTVAKRANLDGTGLETIINTGSGLSGITSSIQNPLSPSTGSAVPSLSEWGLIILALLLLIFGAVVLRRPKLTLEGMNVNTSFSFNELPFDKVSFMKILLAVAIITLIVFGFAIRFFNYELTNADVPGSVVAIPLVTYLMFLLRHEKRISLV